MGYLPLVEVPLGAALPAGAGPDGGALEGEGFSWVVEATGVFCCRGIETGHIVPNANDDSFPGVRTQNQNPISAFNSVSCVQAGLKLMMQLELTFNS